jgi:predicted dehydrogenase
VRFSWPAKTAFHSQPELARNGILSDQGSHVFDLIGWILGRELEPLDVQHDGYAGPETTVRVEFSMGPARGVAVMTWLVAVPTKLEFTGTKGRLILDDDGNRALMQIGGETREISGPVRYATYQAIVNEVVHSFISGAEKPSVASAESTMPSVDFLDRSYQIGKATMPFVTALGAAVQ